MRKDRLALAALSLAFLLLWAAALRTAQWLSAGYQGVSVRMETGVSADAVKAAVKKNNDERLTRVTAWHQGAAATLTNERLGTRAEARPIAVLGGMEDVAPLVILSGALPTGTDEAGCVIDSATAENLYHNSDVVGADLWLGERRLVVRCVVSSDEALLLYRDETASYENLELLCKEAEQGKAAAETFLLRYGLAARYTLVESGFMAALASAAAALPGWVILLSLLWPLLRLLFRRRMIPLQFLALGAALALLLWALPPALGLELWWPARFLPTRWSDFGFWSKLAEEGRAARRALAFLPPTLRELSYVAALRAFARALLAACGAAAVLLCRGRRWLRGAFDATALGILFASTVLACLLPLLGEQAFAPSRAFLFSLPCWWLLDGRSWPRPAEK